MFHVRGGFPPHLSHSLITDLHDAVVVTDAIASIETAAVSTQNRCINDSRNVSNNYSLFPTLMLTNANRLHNKLDELHYIADIEHLDLICITESWLNSDIPDSFCQFDNFLVFRKDRSHRVGGGVIIFARDSLHPRYISPVNTSSLDFELVWITLRPKILLRPLSVIIVAVLCCPPWYDLLSIKSLIAYIISSIDELNRKFDHPGFLFVGDFNSLETDFFRSRLQFRQLVKNSTRGDRILDKIFTNLHEFYSDAVISAPLGRSDHNCVILRPVDRTHVAVGKKNVERRVFSKAAYDDIARDLLSFNWSKMYLVEDV